MTVGSQLFPCCLQLPFGSFAERNFSSVELVVFIFVILARIAYKYPKCLRRADNKGLSDSSRRSAHSRSLNRSRRGNTSLSNSQRSRVDEKARSGQATRDTSPTSILSGTAL